jgi:hypothetical protein
MNSRERVSAAINHRTPDRVPIDLGATGQTGISVSALYRLRQHYGLEQKPLEVFEITQMLGVVDEDLRQVIGADVVGINHPANSLGVPDSVDKKPFIMPDGTPTWIAAANEYDTLPDGGIKMYPQGDRNASPSIYMPSGGYFFDIIDRAGEVDEDDLTPIEDFKDLYTVLSDETARYFEKESRRLFETTDYAIIGNLGGGGLGDPGYIPGAFEKSPRGIRKFDEWMMAQILYPDYVKAVFEYQTEVMLKNLEIYKQAMGERIQIVWISGTDFGTQNAGFFSTDIFQELYKPYYKKMNDWVHQNTNWKTFYHSCGSVVSYLDDFVEMGMDILNPVQLSASGMDARMLKDQYGDKLVFWGGGIDTQEVLPRGTPEQVKAQVQERLDILSKGGGYVFNTIHNIVGNTPVENIAAAFEAVHDYNRFHI